MIVLWYVLTLVVFLLVDLVWLVGIARTFYKRQLGSLMRPRPLWLAAFGFYLLYVVAVLVLAAWPAVRDGAVGDAAWKGALLGLAAYATYDLSNFATLKGWPAQVVAADLAWGTALTTVVSLAAYYLGGWIGV